VSTARKPVIVRKLTRNWCAGYAAASLAEESGELELLDTSGKLLRIPWIQIKWVCYVRELGVAGEPSGSDSVNAPAHAQVNPERLLRRRFSSRPRGAGLWLRITLSDGDELEGIASNDRSLVDGAGLLLIPPDTRSNTQRVFVPRSSIRDLTVLGVISPSHPRGGRPASQPELFDREQNETQLP
jgi:hypothetical protein